MQVLIIGCGYVGMPLGVELARRGHEVFGLRRNQSAREEMVAVGIKPLFADITNSEALAKLPSNFDWVVNCVASGGGTAEDYRNTYLRGMQNVVQWLTPAGTSQPPGVPRMVYTSSTSVYGQNDGLVVDETSETNPVAQTARVLLETEKVLLEAARRKNFSAIVLRVAGIYGPGRGYWLRQFLNGEARLEGDGTRILNMVHRDDVVRAIMAVLADGRAGEIYNVSDDEPVSQLEFFGWLAKALGKNLPVGERAAVRKRSVTNKRISNRKLKDELKFQFSYPTFREGYGEEIKRRREAVS